MSTFKTKVAVGKVAAFVRDTFDNSASDFVPLRGGEASQAFSFDASDEGYVVRVNTNAESFEKDQYAYRHFSSEHIPIPEIVRIGRLDDALHFAISHKVEGRLLDDLSDDAHARTLPSQMKVLDAIRQVDLPHKGQYGDWDADGEAHFDSWRQFLLASWDYYGSQGSRPGLTGIPDPEQDLHQTARAAFEDLVEYCPEDFHLIHGDYGFDNVLADGEKVTGVLDWGGSKYGDFLYDAAWLVFWSDRYDVRMFADHYSRQEAGLAHFDERMRCYRLHIGIGALRFFAVSRQDVKYRWVRERVLSTLSESQGGRPSPSRSRP